MNQNELVKSQFNKQADNFATWSTTVNEDYNRHFFQFCGVGSEDSVLDVACGSGAFAIYCAKHARRVCGVDISDNMIGWAKRQAQQENIGNVEFQCHKVEQLPVEDAACSVVLSKAAYHHFPDPEKVFEEMKRCCKPGGKVCIQDIIAYQDKAIDDYVEQLEKAIDRCHFKTWPKSQFIRMFESSGIAAPRAVEVSVMLDVEDYISHAVQDEQARTEIETLLRQRREDPHLAGIFTNNNGRLSFKRKVLLIRGQKTS